MQMEKALKETSQSFHASSLTMITLESGNVVFPGGAGEPREKPSEEGENQQQTQSTRDTRLESNPGHTGGRRALSPLRHACCPNIDFLTNAAQWTSFLVYVKYLYKPKIYLQSCG